ncbi:hypothetical protein BHM03_00042320 [Ensete ventricosum]|nr:hypothetical protein BHM03_00042320 [Ensete ventricosum]
MGVNASWHLMRAGPYFERRYHLGCITSYCASRMVGRIDDLSVDIVQAASREGAEVEGVLEDSVTGEADVARDLGRPGLRSWLQEHHFGTVDGVRLKSTTVSLYRFPCCPAWLFPFKERSNMGWRSWDEHWGLLHHTRRTLLTNTTKTRRTTSRTCHSEKSSLIGNTATTDVGGSAVLVAEASHGVPLAVAAVEALPPANLGTVLIGRARPPETYTGQPANLRLHALLLLCIKSAYD